MDREGVGIRLGLEQVCYVRLLEGPGGIRAEVAGVCHHRPVTRSVPTSVAGRLIESGVPVVVHRQRPADGADAREVVLS